MKKRSIQKGGFFGVVILVVVAIALLAYFSIDVSGIGQTIISILENIFDLLKGAFLQYLVPMGAYLWNGFTAIFR